MKKYLLLIISFIVCISMLTVFSLAGCKAKEAVTEEAPAEEVEAEEVEPAEEVAEVDTNASFELNTGYYSDTDIYQESMEATIAKFNEKWPNVNVISNIYSYQDYAAPLKLAFSAGEGWDMSFVDYNYLQLLLQYGKLQDLTQVIKDKGWDTLLVDGAFDNSYDAEGNLLYWSVPTIMVPVCMYYNKDIFAELNLQKPRTFDELANMLPIIKDAGYNGFAMIGSNNVTMLFLMWSLMYGRTTVEDMDNWYYLRGTSENWKEQFIWAAGVVNDWQQYYQPNWQAADWYSEAYAQGDTAMVVSGDWDMPAFLDSGINTGAMIIPNRDVPYDPDDPETSVRIVSSANGGWALNAELSPEKTTAAIDLIATFLDPETQKMWYENGMTSVIKLDTTGIEVNPIREELNEELKNTTAGRYLDTAPVPGLVQEFAMISQLMTTGQSTPEEFWDQFNAYYEANKPQ